MRKSIKYAITYGVGAVIALIVCLNSNIFQSENTLNTVKILSDAFFTQESMMTQFWALDDAPVESADFWRESKRYLMED